MIVPPVPPPDPVPAKPPDLTTVVFRFDAIEWADPPEYASSDPNDLELVYRRQANDNVYSSIGTASTWYRYITLGYYALDDALAFDKAWDRMDTEPLTIHRIIWYNFLYHVDRDMDIEPKLNAWATQVSEGYLTQHDPTSLEMNTMRYSFKDAIQSLQRMNVDEEDNDSGDWTTVQGSRRNRARSRTAQSLEETTRPHTDDTAPEDEERFEPPSTPALQGNLPRNPTMQTEGANHQQQNNQHVNTTGETFSIAGRSMSRPGIKPATHVSPSTHDGTQRITIRWTCSDAERLKTLENDHAQLNAEVMRLIQHLFVEEDGHFYRWESTNLLNAYTVAQMTTAMIREFTSPHVTFIHSKSLMVFGIRFGFKTNSVKWKSLEKREKLDNAQLHVTISNSICNSGNLVTAGYILLKAPNTTHRHRYTQHLREQLPPGTPYFDVVRLAKSPMDQAIPHLAIQCGEHHVTPLCKALSNYLTGSKTAIFLPRYSFQTMTENQISQHFSFHEKWNKSLTAIAMGMTITHLDQPRTEYYRDGTTCVRSTREWATSLMLSDGMTPALCDVVNGTNDRRAMLLTPRHYETEARIQWNEYKSRISPPSHRETRFQASVPDLPDVINITTEIQANVQFLERISAADIWSQAPPSVRAATTNTNDATSSKTSVSQLQRKGSQQQPINVDQRVNNYPPLNRHSGGARQSTTSSEDNGFPPLSGHGSSSSSIASDDQSSTESTQGTTRASQSTYQARFHEHEQLMKRQQKAIESLGKSSSDRLSLIERQLHRFDAFDTKLASVGSQMDQFSIQQTEVSARLHTINQHNAQATAQAKTAQEQSDQKIDALSKTVVAAMTALLDMRTQFENISQHVHNISSHMISNTQSTEPQQHSEHQSAGTTTQSMTSIPNKHERERGQDRTSVASVNSESTKSTSSGKSQSSTYSAKSPVKKKRNCTKEVTEPTQLTDVTRNLNVQMSVDRHRSFCRDVVHFDTASPINEDTQTNISMTQESHPSREEEEPFMTPPSSPTANSPMHYNISPTAPPNLQYNSTMDSAGAPPK